MRFTWTDEHGQHDVTIPKSAKIQLVDGEVAVVALAFGDTDQNGQADASLQVAGELPGPLGTVFGVAHFPPGGGFLVKNIPLKQVVEAVLTPAAGAASTAAAAIPGAGPAIAACIQAAATVAKALLV